MRFFTLLFAIIAVAVSGSLAGLPPPTSTPPPADDVNRN